MKTGMMTSVSRLATALGLAGVMLLGTMSSYPVNAANAAQGAQGQSMSTANSPAAAAVLQLLGARPAATTGQSATQLADGGWLLLGGTAGATASISSSGGSGGTSNGTSSAGGKPTAGAWRVDPVKGGTTALSAQLNVARSGHTATLLPDGTVLVLGGTSAGGAVTSVAERFDPVSGSFNALGAVGVLARSGHSATVLPDGRVLIAGGVDAKGAAVREVEVYDPLTGGIERASDSVTRQQHRAALLPEGGVLLWGGADAQGQALPRGALYDAATQRWSAVTAEVAAKAAQSLGSAAAPAVLESQPASGAAQVPVAQRLMVRFSKRMDVGSLNAATVTLVGPNGAVKLDAVGVEGGVLLFVTPRQELLPNAAFTLFVQGAKDEFGQALPMQAIGFRTAALGKPGKGNGVTPGSAAATPAPVTAAPKPTPAASAPVVMDEDERWIPGQSNFGGNWTSGRRHQAERTMPQQARVRWALHGDPAFAKLRPADVAAKRLPRAPQSRVGDGTSVSGQVLRLNGKPLANVTLAIGERRTRTDANGEFTLRNAPSGRQILVIDGGTANNGDYKYGRYEYGMEVTAGEDNALPFVSWMTPLDTAHTVTIASPTTAPVVLTNPAVPGLELRIPAGTVIRDTQGKIVTELSLTAIPVDQPPFPLPAFPVPVYFTVQPGGSHLVGIDAKSAKGAQLIYPNFAGSKPGTRVNFWDYDAKERGWFMYGQGAVSADGKQVVPDPGVVIYEFTGAMIAKPDIAPPLGPDTDGCECGDPVDMYTGLFLNNETDVVINDVMPITISRSFRQADETSRAFGIGTGLSYDTFLVGNAYPYTYQNLVLSNGGHVWFQRVSSGTSYTDAVYKSQDYSGGLYTGAILKWDASYPGATWSITLRDGTVYYYPMSYNAADYRNAAAIAIKDRNGNLTTLSRSSGNLTKVTSPNGRTVTLTYDTVSRITKITDDIAREWKYEYDTQGRLIKATDPLNNSRQYTYESKVLDPSKSMAGITSMTAMLTVVDKRGNTMVTNAYDDAGRVAKQTYADGTTMSFAYGTTLTKIPPRTVFTCFVSGGGPGIDLTDASRSCQQTVDTAVVNQVDVTDQRGTVTRLVFDEQGKLAKKIEAVGLPEEQTRLYNRDAATGQILNEVDALGRKTAYEYDALGNVTKTTRLAGTANAVNTSSVYETIYSRPITLIDANGNASSMQYDASGNLTRIENAMGEAVKLSYDHQGKLIGIEDALHHRSTFSYTGGDLSAYIDALGNRSTLFADSVGRIKGITDSLGNSRFAAFDAMDRLISLTDSMGGTMRLQYDANGNVLAQTDENLNVTSFTYDKRDRQLSRKDALQQTSKRLYEPGGIDSQRVDRKGQLKSIVSIDGLGRPVKVGFGATESNPSSFKSTVSYTWDKADRATQFVDSVSGTIVRTYDDFDRLLSETSQNGTVSYTYDTGGRRQSIAVSGQPTVRYTWDAADRITRISQDAGSVNGNTAQEIIFSYDEVGRRSRVFMANGIVRKYSYDARGQILGISYANSNGVVFEDINYSYDAGGRRVSVEGSLVGATVDAEVLNTEFDSNGRLIKRNGQTLSYDSNGNLTNDGQRIYVWDERDRLVGVSGENATTYQYDSLGRRLSRSVAGFTTLFVSDGANLAQTIVNGVPVAHVGGLNLDELYAVYRGGMSNHLLIDALGSTLATTDAQQMVVSRNTYSAYGRAALVGSDMSDGQFTGRESDKNGLLYYRARYYSPELSRFISEDPIGWSSGQSNLYAYVGGDPISRSDPSGLCPMCLIPALPYVGEVLVLGAAWWISQQSKTPNEGTPGSWHTNPGSGQERLYGPNGRPEVDIDWDHDHGQGQPHNHNWGPKGREVPEGGFSPWPRGRGNPACK
ncbi:RHS repeat-associated core domain-containing protein [Roseateles noduli]|uniref:RHS repeat-associated core domain-containing protein n=1 Tax=Roseateles noduli TaxID=2052484 RepID=UPI003D64FAF2